MTGSFQLSLENVVMLATAALTAFNTYIMLRMDHKISLLKIWSLERFQKKRGAPMDSGDE